MTAMKKMAEDCCTDWQSNRTIIQCLDYLLKHSLETDVTFVLGKNGEKAQAHSFILKARSPVLCKVLSAGSNPRWEITLVQSNKRIMTMFLRYLYSDTITLNRPDAYLLMALGKQFKVQNLVTLCQLFLKRTSPESRQESDNEKWFQPLGAFTCYTGSARLIPYETGHDRVNTDQGGYATVVQDETGHASFTTVGTGHATVPIDKYGHAIVNKDETGHASFTTDGTGHASFNTDRTGHASFNTDGTGHASFTTDGTGLASFTTDGTGHATVPIDKYGHARVNKDESGHASFTTDGTGHASFNTVGTGHASFNTDGTGHASFNTVGTGHASFNTDDTGHASFNTDDTGHTGSHTRDTLNTIHSGIPERNISLQKQKPGSGVVSTYETGHTRVNTAKSEHAGVTTRDTSEGIIAAIPEENLSLQKLKSVNDNASTKSSRALTLELRRKCEIDNEPISVENSSLMMPENSFKQNFVKSDTAMSSHEDGLVTQDDCIKRRYVGNVTTKSVDIKFQLPLHQQDSKQKCLKSVLRSEGVVLPKNSLTIYAKNKPVTLKNLEDSVINKLLGKTTQKQPLDILFLADPGDETPDVKCQRLRYVYTGKSSESKLVGEAILGTTSKEHCLGDKDSRNISQDRYLVNNISPNQNTGKNISGKTSLAKQKCSKNLRVKPLKQSEKDVSDTQSQEQTHEKSSSKVKPPRRRWRKMISGTNSPHSDQGKDMSIGGSTQGDSLSEVTTPKRQLRNKILHTSGDSSSRIITPRRQWKKLGTPQPDQIYDISDMSALEENVGNTSKITTQQRRLRRKITSDSSSSQPNQGSDDLNTDPGRSCNTTPGWPCDATDITVPTTKAICDNLVTYISGCDVSVDVLVNSSDGCKRNSSNGSMSSACVDRNNGTSTKPAVHDNQNTIKAGIGKENSKLIVTEDCTIDIQPVISDNNRSHAVREIIDFDRQIRNLQADLINNHCYLLGDNDGSLNCQDDCMIVGVEGDENPSNVDPTYLTEDDKVATLDQMSTAKMETDKDKIAPALDLKSTTQSEFVKDEMTAALDTKTAPCQTISETVKRPVKPCTVPKHLADDISSGNTPQTKSVQKNRRNEHHSYVKNQRKRKIVESTTIIEKECVKERHTGEVKRKRVTLNMEDRPKRRKKFVENETELPTPPLLDKCKVCGKQFASVIALLIHMRDHAGEEIHSHRYCGKGFTLRGSHQHHMQRHGIQTQDCNFSGKRCSSKHNRNAHENEKALKCNICGMECEKKVHYMNHMHRGNHKKTILKHRCQKCGEVFMFKKDLVRHKKLHMEVKPFECRMCSDTFWSRTRYQGHSKRHKEEENQRKVYRCHVCAVVFPSPESLFEHSEIHNDGTELNVRTSDQLKNDQKQDNTKSKVRKFKKQKKSKKLGTSNSNFFHSNSQKEGQDLHSSVSNLVHSNLCKYNQEQDSAKSSNLVNSNLQKDCRQQLNTSSSGSTLVHSDCHKSSQELESSEENIAHTNSQQDNVELDSVESNLVHYNPDKDSQGLNSLVSDLFHSDSQKGCNEMDNSENIVHRNSQNNSEEVGSSQSQFGLTKTQIGESLICEICGKSFSCIQSLKTHQKIHSIWDGFECVLCKKVFRKKYYLERHYKHHSGEWYFPCNQCDEGFDKKMQLLQHQCTAHNKKMAFSYSCIKCPLVFTTHRAFRSHMMSHARNTGKH